MNKFFKLGLAALALCAVAGLASAQSRAESRQVDARVVRVKLDGVVDLRIRQGSAPALVLSGEPGWSERSNVVQNGDTLNISAESHGINLRRQNALHADLTLPQLREVYSESVGSTEVSGFSGDELELTLDGAGSMKVWCNYKVITARLGGIGNMDIGGLNGDGIDLELQGAGHVTLAGRSKWLKADLGGLGDLDAQQFAADTVSLDLSGLGNATVTAHQSANLNLSGLGSVTVYGKPLNRKVSVDGLGKVSWK
jgi:hypothetical protein